MYDIFTSNLTGVSAQTIQNNMEDIDSYADKLLLSVSKDYKGSDIMFTQKINYYS